MGRGRWTQREKIAKGGLAVAPLGAWVFADLEAGGQQARRCWAGFGLPRVFAPEHPRQVTVCVSVHAISIHCWLNVCITRTPD